MIAFDGPDSQSMPTGAHGVCVGSMIRTVSPVRPSLPLVSTVVHFISYTGYVDCVITDGLEMGRPCCMEAHCRGPLRTPQDRYCAGHMHRASFCVVVGCCFAHREGFRTCPEHAAVEDHHVATGKAMFTLRTCLQRAKVALPTDAIEPSAPADEDVEVETEEAAGEPSTSSAGPCPVKTADGDHVRVRARFGRRRTHNEQLIVRPCGIITCRETFYGSETVPQVVVRVHTLLVYRSRSSICL